ncbi:hypothetical protein ACSMXN_01755 [Jatrophihabitans sp. DSM 45814]
MNQRSVVEFAELDAQSLELLPAKETLFNINVMPIIGVNISLALNAATVGSTANSYAGQQFLALQHF